MSFYYDAENSAVFDISVKFLHSPITCIRKIGVVASVLVLINVLLNIHINRLKRRGQDLLKSGGVIPLLPCSKRYIPSDIFQCQNFLLAFNQSGSWRFPQIGMSTICVTLCLFRCTRGHQQYVNLRPQTMSGRMRNDGEEPEPASISTHWFHDSAALQSGLLLPGATYSYLSPHMTSQPFILSRPQSQKVFCGFQKGSGSVFFKEG